MVTSDLNLYEKALVLSNHGRSENDPGIFSPQKLGYKFKMSNVQAAIGCGQVERIKELVKKKQEILETYRKLFSKDKNLKLLPMFSEKNTRRNALSFSQSALNLPSFHTMTNGQIEFVAESIFDILSSVD